MSARNTPSYTQTQHYSPNLIDDISEVNPSQFRAITKAQQAQSTKEKSADTIMAGDPSYDKPCCTKKRCSITCEIILVVLGILLVVQMFIIPNLLESIFESNLESNLIITQDDKDQNTTAYQHWTAQNSWDGAPIEKFQFYLFNITNPYDVVHNFAYPNLTEMGPFTYKRYEYRRNPIYDENSTTVEYTYEYEFEYMPEWSNEDYDLNDTIIVFNPALLTLFKFMNDYANPQFTYFDPFFETLPASHVFYYTTVWDVLWNESDPTIENEQRFAGANTFFAAVNTVDNQVVEYTGADDVNNLRKLIKYTNLSSVDFWGCFNESDISSNFSDSIYYDPDCTYKERVFGSRESKQFPYGNWVTKSSILEVWSLDKYRKVNYVYDKQVTRNGLSLYRFKLDTDTFLNATNNPYNNHFYQFGFDGIVNLTNRKEAITQKTVVYVSKGHFLDGNYYVNTVNRNMGLRDPNDQIDDQYLDVEPRSGAVFHRYLSYMVNLGVFPLDEITVPHNFSNITDMIVPYYMLIVDAEASDDYYDYYTTKLNQLDSYTDVSIYAGPSIAVVCFAIAIWLCFRRKQKDISKDDSYDKPTGGRGTKKIASASPNDSTGLLLGSPAEKSYFGAQDEGSGAAPSIYKTPSSTSRQGQNDNNDNVDFMISPNDTSNGSQKIRKQNNKNKQNKNKQQSPLLEGQQRSDSNGYNST